MPIISYFGGTYFYRFKVFIREEINNERSNNNLEIEQGNNLIQLRGVEVENTSTVNNNKFKPSAEDKNKIIVKENNCIFFNDSCIIQGKYLTLIPESVYYEIELINFTDNYEFLFGYADKSTSQIHESHILLSNRIYGMNINKKEYPNTFVHTLKKGDIIGCFYDRFLGEITFTYNGNDLCYYFFQLGVIYPTIYSTKGTLLKYNFGNKSFLYRRANQLKLGIGCNYIQEVPPSY
ncbi:hypothetical protein K502DRAFT_367142 [Neoconidiobolus thromboides FSU 785]|nr:hypothetical protein K502DRAFT_367142 [Neoconidiobolus thromboides FSU 785]